MSGKAEAAGGLSPAKDDNAAGRKIDCKDGALFKWFDYIIGYMIIISDGESIIRGKTLFKKCIYFDVVFEV